MPARKAPQGAAKSAPPAPRKTVGTRPAPKPTAAPKAKTAPAPKRPRVAAQQARLSQEIDAQEPTPVVETPPAPTEAHVPVAAASEPTAPRYAKPDGRYYAHLRGN